MSNATGVNNFLFGSLHLELRGVQISAVIHQLQVSGVRLEHIRVHQDTTTLVVGLQDFWSLYRACRQFGVKLRVISRQGLPFVIRHFKKRKMMVAGMVLFTGLLLFFNSLIWSVTVHGVSEETSLSVLQVAKESGLYVGVWKSSVANLQVVQARILKRMPSLVWIGIDIAGSQANLQVVERIDGVSGTSSAPHNLVASKPAVIQRIFANRGDVVVRPGQVVQPGQILISGDLGQGKLVPASGLALAEVWYTSEVALPLAVTRQELTGASVSHQDLAVGPLALRILGWQQPDYRLETESVSQTNWHLGTWRLPLQWRIVTDYEVTAGAVTKTQMQAQQEALELARQDVFAQAGSDVRILGQTVLQLRILHGKLYATVLTRAEEDIGVPASIPTS